MSEQGDLSKATRNILVRSLELNRDQNLLIFTDPNAVDVAEAVAKAAGDLDVLVSIVYVSQCMQEHFESWERLPHPIEAAMQEADAILTAGWTRGFNHPLRSRR